MTWLDRVLNGPSGGRVLLAFFLGFWIAVMGLIVALIMFA